MCKDQFRKKTKEKKKLKSLWWFQSFIVCTWKCKGNRRWRERDEGQIKPNKMVPCSKRSCRQRWWSSTNGIKRNINICSSKSNKTDPTQKITVRGNTNTQHTVCWWACGMIVCPCIRDQHNLKHSWDIFSLRFLIVAVSYVCFIHSVRIFKGANEFTVRSFTGFEMRTINYSTEYIHTHTNKHTNGNYLYETRISLCVSVRDPFTMCIRYTEEGK